MAELCAFVAALANGVPQELAIADVTVAKMVVPRRVLVAHRMCCGSPRTFCEARRLCD